MATARPRTSADQPARTRRQELGTKAKPANASTARDSVSSTGLTPESNSRRATTAATAHSAAAVATAAYPTTWPAVSSERGEWSMPG